MPQYDYKCSNDHIYTEFRSILENSKTDVCPECNATLKQIYSPPMIELKGSGFYRNSKK
jgi:putative FmdB family regulatory protein